MEVAIFLAKFWGWYFLIFFFILGFNPIRIRQIILDLKDQKFLIIIACLAIIMGIISLLFHNIWELHWTFLITVIGWMFLLLGLGLLMFPDPSARKLEQLSVRIVQGIYLILFLVGVYLLNMAYDLVPIQ